MGFLRFGTAHVITFFYCILRCSTLVMRYLIFSFCAAEAEPPPLVEDIHEWVSRVLPYTAGIREWSAFRNTFGPKLPNLFPLFFVSAWGGLRKVKAHIPAFH